MSTGCLFVISHKEHLFREKHYKFHRLFELKSRIRHPKIHFLDDRQFDNASPFFDQQLNLGSHFVLRRILMFCLLILDCRFEQKWFMYSLWALNYTCQCFDYKRSEKGLSVPHLMTGGCKEVTFSAVAPLLLN